MLNFYLKKILNSRVYDVAKETPLDFATNLSQRLNKNIYLKREDTQPTFSFKIRGAYNKIVHLPFKELKKGIIAASAGNHAQGVSLAASRLNVKSTIVMPNTTPRVKIEAVKKLGSKIITKGDSYSEAFEYANKIGENENLVFIHPFDDDYVIAGQGTIGMEILRQSACPIDAIFVAVGGGGLVSGVGAYIKAVRPSIKIVGVQTEDSDAMYRSLKVQKRIKLNHVGLFSDGTAVKQVGEKTFKLSQIVIDEMILVNTDEVCAAIKDIFEDTRCIQEPAGALALAGLKKWTSQKKNIPKNLIAITCGANLNFDRLRFISERSELGEEKETLLSVTLPEARGSFLKFCGLIKNKNLTEFNYRISNESSANVFVGVQVKNKVEGKAVMGTLRKEGFLVTDLTHDEVSKLHIRHMVGGRSSLAVNERLYRFEFPERPGALIKFLSSMNNSWNISLFHYRNHGSDTGRILVGLQVPPGEIKSLNLFLKSLGYNYTNETTNTAYNLFLK
ncbi:MAG: threonine ammonia-lyase, biosynthetic [Betaproteobacteria bacterium TMED156]|nr:MAG: threonine ammonia-lyase, biosynthetic [Betaproteobacteria bacterium TMED156]